MLNKNLLSISPKQQNKGDKVMRKTHYKVTLVVFIHSDEGVDVASLIEESGFLLEGATVPTTSGLGWEVQDVIIKNIEVVD